MIKKSFFAVLLAAIAVFAFGTAQAEQIDGLTNGLPALPTGLTMFVNPGGTGDALIYGYYNARGSFNLLKVVNTNTSFGVSAKVRFREGRNSNEVLDFAICLSAGDQWTAWVLEPSATSPATILWYDSDTPTQPDPNGNDDATDNFLAAVPFKYGSTGAASSVTLDDTKEGYFEIIGATAWADTPGANKVVAKPSECADAAGISGVNTATLDVPNSLAGSAYIFNVAAGAGAYGYNATALANFRNAPITISLASDSSPRLDDATDINANLTGIDEVNYVLTKATEVAFYDVQSALGGATDIINTFPTKRLSIQNLVANGPFNDDAVLDTATGEIKDDVARCEAVGFTLFDDKEKSPTVTTGFSPGETQVLAKCDEVSLITVGATASPLLNSKLVQFNLNNSGFQLGWIREDFTGTGRSTTLVNETTSGLPVISYELQGLLNGFFTTMLPLRYTTVVTP